jgi:hypothetical protein
MRCPLGTQVTVTTSMSRLKLKGHRCASPPSASGSHTHSTWRRALDGRTRRPLYSPAFAPKAIVLRPVNGLRRVGMPEESVKRKVLRAAKKILSPEFQFVENRCVLLLSMISRSKPGAASFAGTISTTHIRVPGPTLSLLVSLPRRLTGYGANSNPPRSLLRSQPTLSSFHSGFPTSHSRFYSKSSCVALSCPSKTRGPHGITKCLPNGCPSPRFAVNGEPLPTRTLFCGPRSRQISTTSGWTSCESVRSPYCSMFTFASAGATSMIAKRP